MIYLLDSPLQRLVMLLMFVVFLVTCRFLRNRGVAIVKLVETARYVLLESLVKVNAKV